MASCSELTDLRRARALLGTGCPGPTGPQGLTGASGATILRGNVLVVDSVYGVDATASVGGSAWLTVAAAVTASSSGQTIWIMPGTYTLASGITLKDGTAMRGLNVQTVTLQMNVTSSTTMITMGENCRLEDCTLNLTCTGSTDNVVLKGIVFGGTSSQSSKLRTSVVNIRNSAMAKTLTSTVTGVEFSGTGTLASSTFSINSLKGSTINVYSNGAGNKRGVLISNSNQVSTRDVNIFIAQPINTDSTGSYVGVETADAGNTGSIQLRTTTCGVVFPTAGQAYTASDILQTNPSTITDPTYLASAGIQIGPGTDLVTKSAGSKGFSTFNYPTIIYYGLKGTITSATNSSYCWPGTQAISAGVFPDNGSPAAYFRVQQPALISGLAFSTNIAPGGTNSITLLIRITPSGGSIADTIYTATISGTNTQATFYNGSVRCNAGDYIHLLLSYVSGSPANAAHDLTAQIDLF